MKLDVVDAAADVVGDERLKRRDRRKQTHCRTRCRPSANGFRCGEKNLKKKI
jgi:hypothetical protein